MQKHERRCVEEATKFLEPLGFTVSVEYRGSRKSKLFINAIKDGQLHRRMLASSPGNGGESEIFHLRSWMKKITRT